MQIYLMKKEEILKVFYETYKIRNELASEVHLFFLIQIIEIIMVH